MSYRNILLNVLAFLALQLACATAVAAQQQPTQTDKDKAKKTEKSETDEAKEPVEPRQSTPDDRLDPSGPAAIGGDKRYRIEVGILPRYNSNLFEAEDDATKRSSYITTLSARAEYDFVRNDRRTVTGIVQFRHNIFKDVDQANSTDIDVGMRFRSGKNDLQTTYFTTPERLAFITAGDLYVHSGVQGFNLDYTRRLTRRLRAGGSYQLTRETYEGTTFDDRDNTRHRLTGEVRYRLSNLFQPGVGVEYERVSARSENFERNALAPILLLVSSYEDVIYTSARYRYIRRDYLTDDPLLPNFDRRDLRHDFSIYSTIKLAERWRLYAFYNSLDNNSSRVGRSFTGYQTGVGLFFRFP